MIMIRLYNQALSKLLPKRFSSKEHVTTGKTAAQRPAPSRSVVQKHQPPTAHGSRDLNMQAKKQDPAEKPLLRQRYVREDSGTHETLKILDESLVETGEETGIDPYNTGQFDRSKNWGNRFSD
jgi:hypothetical protein